MPALKLQAIALDSIEGVTRTEIAGNGIGVREVRETRSIRMQGVEVGAVRDLDRRQAWLRQQDARGADTERLSILREVIGDFARVWFGGGSSHADEAHRRRQTEKRFEGPDGQ